MEKKQLTDFEKGWLSGAIDADGGFSFCWIEKRKQWQCYLALYNSCYDFIEYAHQIIGVGTIYSDIDKRKPTYRKMFRYRITGGQQIKTLNWLLPQLKLIAKKEHSEIMLKVLSLLEDKNKNYNQLHELSLKLRFINLKGKYNQEQRRHLLNREPIR